MSNWNTQRVKTLKKQWQTITSGRNVSDHALATWAQRTIKTLPAGEFKEFVTSKKGLDLHANTHRLYERMSLALDKVPDASVWKAVGWDGVRLLTRIEKVKEVRAICRWVTTSVKKAPVTDSALVARIEEKAKSYKPVGGPPKKGKKKGPTKKALTRQVDRLTHANTVLTQKHEILVAEVTRIIANWPVIKNDLSKETLAILGLTEGQLPKKSA